MTKRKEDYLDPPKLEPNWNIVGMLTCVLAFCILRIIQGVMHP